MRGSVAAVVAFAGLLASCAVGTSFKERQPALPPVPSDKARLFIYRPPEFWASMVQPRILLGDIYVGDAVPGGVRFFDLPPGLHCVTVEKSPLVPKSGSPTRCVEMRKGGIEYVRMTMGNRDVIHARYYNDVWRDGSRVRVYEPFLDVGPCQPRSGMQCESHAVTQHYNDVRIVDAATGRSETLDLALLEPSARP